MSTKLDRALELLRAELDELSAHRPIDRHWSHCAPWAIFGSTVMLLHGVRLGREPSDVDVFVDPWVWQQLANGLNAWEVELPDPADPPYVHRSAYGVKLCAFYRWTAQDPEVNADHCRLTAYGLHGYLVTPLTVVRMHKLMASKHGDSPRHAKHARDVAAIDQWLAEAGPGWAGPGWASIVGIRP